MFEPKPEPDTVHTAVEAATTNDRIVANRETKVVGERGHFRLISLSEWCRRPSLYCLEFSILVL